MVRFRDISIRRKLLLINVFTTSMALMLASSAFISYERLRFHEDVTRQLGTVADVIGPNAGAALSAHDKGLANQVLGGLRAEPRILAACLYGRDGRMLACYAREPGADRVFPGQAGAGIQSQNGDLLISRPILTDGRKIGALWMRFDPRVSLETLRREVGLVSLSMAVCFIVAVLLSTRLQRTISVPLSGLARTAEEVAAGSNYELRAERCGNDEVGHLVDAFNQMLARLGENTAELRSIYDSAIDAIVTVTREGVITSWNKGAERLFGFHEAEVTGQKLLFFLTEASRPAYLSQLGRVRALDDALSAGKLMNLTGLRQDRTEFSLEATLAHWSTKKVAFYTSFMRDTGERRLLEAQLTQAQKLESIGQLAAGVAHEINTPIQYVSDNAKFLQDAFRDLIRFAQTHPQSSCGVSDNSPSPPVPTQAAVEK